MAKKTFTHTIGPDGKPMVVEQSQLTRHQRKSLTEIPFTAGPGTSKLKRLKRNLIG